jgi:S-adenosylmethionine synthetase
VVAAGLASRCEVQVAYAIGVAQPVGVYVQTFGTGRVDEEKLARYIQANFDMRPKAIIDQLDLLTPIYRRTAAYGHFGRSGFTWENTDRAAELAQLLPTKLRPTETVRASKHANGRSNGHAGVERKAKPKAKAARAATAS